jgi:hypothetical protein
MDTEHEPLSDDEPDVSVEMDDLVVDAPPPRFPVEKVVFGVFAGVAVLMLVVAAATGYATARALAREQTAAGRVVELTPRTVSVPVETDDPNRKRYVDREYFYPVVEFDLPDGTRKRVQTAEGSWPPAYEAGQAVTVRYDRENPLVARIESGSLLHWTWTLITGGLGLAFTVATAIIYRVFIRR